MATFLVTGNPGSGKSTLADELARRGLATIDPDYDAALSYWEDDSGNRVTRAEGPAVPDELWLTAHRWVWNDLDCKSCCLNNKGPCSCLASR